MKVKYRKFINSPFKKGESLYCDKGTCLVYRATKDDTNRNKCDHVTLDFGDEQILLDVDSFMLAIRSIFGERQKIVKPSNVVCLKVIK